jgi:hypothetical protein
VADKRETTVAGQAEANLDPPPTSLSELVAVVAELTHRIDVLEDALRASAALQLGALDRDAGAAHVRTLTAVPALVALAGWLLALVT